MKNETKEVVKKETYDLSFISDSDKGLGFENTDSQDLLMPRALLLQKLSPVLDERDDLYAAYYSLDAP